MLQSVRSRRPSALPALEDEPPVRSLAEFDARLRNLIVSPPEDQDDLLEAGSRLFHLLGPWPGTAEHRDRALRLLLAAAGIPPGNDNRWRLLLGPATTIASQQQPHPTRRG